MIGSFAKGSAAKGSALWAMAAAGLLWFVASQVADDRPTLSDVVAAPVETSGNDEAAATRSITVLPSEDLIDGIVERPLFSQSRRPVLPATGQRPEAEKTSDETLSLELIGTILVGDVHIALLNHPTEGLIRRKPGQSIGDWTLVDVEKNRVSLESEDGSENLSLRKDRTQPPKPQNPIKPSPTDAPKSQAKMPNKPPAPASSPVRRPI